MASIYHERQSRQLCALHVLNNLLQVNIHIHVDYLILPDLLSYFFLKEKAFTKAQLDDICTQLAPDNQWWNPHRSPLGLGNYDVNVMMAALQGKDCQAIWFDKRK